ncbi:hypothetical protein PoB_004491600 [Plakobranchus ocellatus]|uniref:Uncharacterized protein n=1 Tax=Plakobranchus ocellatus TaxID=259542 RepID=A0AAV4BDB8_9GAST|nr:hypothetical protein PoB_004491600 [Plakobranchus ocellatus]
MRGMGGSFARHQRHSPVFGHHHGSRSPTAANSPAGTPPHGGSGARDGEGGDGQINSILLPVNQRYLASKGYYRQQGWPRGSYIEPEEDREAAGEETRADAMSKRKMFQKTRSQRQNWSLCDSGEKENDLASHGGGGGAGGDKTRTSSSGRDEWFTKSMDDSLSQDEGMRARIDSVGLNTFFSTTTEESSTDSLDAGGSDTERALEEIRRQYYESQNSERKESEELFLPKRKGDKKTSFGDLLNSSGIGVFQEEDSEENAEEDKVKKARRFGTGDAVLDRLKISSDGDDEGTGGSYLIPDENNRSNNYFISPASSRQTTVEKSPTLHSSNDDDFPHNEDNCNTNEGDNNNNSPDEKDKVVATNNRANLKERGGRTDSKEVKIIVSSFSSGTSWQSNSKSSSASPEIGKMTEANVGNNNNSSNSSNNNKLTVERAQQASSDSGSSSSGATTVGVPVSTDADADGATPRNVLSEESDGITDRDSISRTHSPCGFPPSRPDSGSRTRSDSHKFALTTSCCQTSETDFIMAAQAELGEAVNATVRRSSPLAALGISARAQNKSGGADTSTTQQKEGGDRLSVKEADREGDTGSGDGQSKVRLSALPTSINPLELMRRLRRSQGKQNVMFFR